MEKKTLPFATLHGRSALITGGASGIGRAIALAMAQAGARIAVLDIVAERRADDEPWIAEAVEALGGEIEIAAADVSDEANVDAGLARIARRFPHIDILVNNAGLIANFGTLETMDRSAWDRELAVNLSGAFALAKRVVPAMAERGWGRVITLSSCAAWCGSPVQVGYAATKAGLIGLSNTLARAYGPNGVTSNAILPGFVSTRLVNAHFPKEERARVERAVAIRRFVAPEEVAAVAVFLASPAAAAINGAAIPIDGGMALSAGNIDG